jgi:hypothetical protein
VGLLLRSPKPLENRQAIHPGKHQVEDNDVIVVRLSVPQTGLALGGFVDRKARFPQAECDRFAENLEVFYNQHAHRAIAGRGSRTRESSGNVRSGTHQSSDAGLIQFNRDPEDIPESRRQPALSGMSGSERVFNLPPRPYARSPADTA